MGARTAAAGNALGKSRTGCRPAPAVGAGARMTRRRWRHPRTHKHGVPPGEGAHCPRGAKLGASTLRALGWGAKALRRPTALSIARHTALTQGYIDGRSGP